MNESGRADGHRSPTPPAATLSPLVKPLPTGYRNLQPFQRGQGWHSNGRPKRSKPSPRQLRGSAEIDDASGYSPERVVFPAIQGQESRSWKDDRLGPNAESVDRSLENDPDGQDDGEGRDRQAEARERSTENGAPSPSSEDPVVSMTFRSMTPQHLGKTLTEPPSAPRRPVSVGGDPHGSISFRARSLVTATSAGITGSSRNNASGDSRSSSPSIADVSAGFEPRTKNAAVQTKRTAGPRSVAELISSEDASTPDPAMVQQLWQEFSERAQAQRAIDKDEYHRKMQHKYNERKLLREQAAQLQLSLKDMRKERDDLLQRLGLESSDEYELGGADGSISPVPSPRRSPIPSPRLSPRAAVAPENDFDRRERNFQLERALVDIKQQLADTEELLSKRQTDLQGEIDDLKARLELERRANATLARQLRETASSFQITTDELVDTRVELEREQIARQVDREHFEERMQQLLVDHRRALVVADANQALRNLGRRALHDKVKAFDSRTMVAEQRMRVALEEVSRLKLEVSSKQRCLEQFMSLAALKPPIPMLNSAPASCLGDASLCSANENEMVLFHGTRFISGREYLLHVVCEDSRAASTDAEAFQVYFVAFDPVSGQNGRISFGLSDIQRLVTDYSSYLEKNKLGYRQRVGNLAALLLKHIHAGFTSGRLVLCELPSLSVSPCCSNNTSEVIMPTKAPVLREVVVYRGTMAIDCCDHRSPVMETITADLTVNEVFSSESPDQWWVEIHAVFIDGFPCDSDGGCDIQDDYVLKVDHQQLVSLSDVFGSYRPSDRLGNLSPDASQDLMELIAVHEAMLQQLLVRLRVFIVTNNKDDKSAVRLGISVDPDLHAMEEADSAPTGVEAFPEPSESRGAAEDGAVSTVPSTSKPASRTLDHRSIVNIGGVFYCARFLELWDDELLLEVTLDDPESSVRVTGVLREQHLSAIASYLHVHGAVESNFAAQLEFGLAAELQAPLCKLLAKHLRKSRIDFHSPLGVSFTSLLREIGFVEDDDQAESSAACHAKPTSSLTEAVVQSASILSHDLQGDTVKPCIIALGCHGLVSEEQIHCLVKQTKTPKACGLRQSRRGVRLRADSGRRELALMHIYEGFTGFGGLLAVCYPLLPEGDTGGPRTVVVNASLGPQALELLGVEQDAE